MNPAAWGRCSKIISALLWSPLFHSPVVSGYPLLDKIGLNGIVSANFFSKQPITFNLKSRRLVFDSKSQLRERIRHGHVIPLKLTRDRDINLSLFASFSFAPGVAGECYLDTGLDGVVLNQRFMPELNISAEDKRVKKIERPTLMGGKETRYRTVLTAISATSYPGLTMSGFTVDFQDLIYDCAIGFPHTQGHCALPTTYDG